MFNPLAPAIGVDYAQENSDRTTIDLFAKIKTSGGEYETKYFKLPISPSDKISLQIAIHVKFKHAERQARTRYHMKALNDLVNRFADELGAASGSPDIFWSTWYGR